MEQDKSYGREKEIQAKKENIYTLKFKAPNILQVWREYHENKFDVNNYEKIEPNEESQMNEIYH